MQWMPNKLSLHKLPMTSQITQYFLSVFLLDLSGLLSCPWPLAKKRLLPSFSSLKAVVKSVANYGTLKIWNRGPNWLAAKIWGWETNLKAAERSSSVCFHPLSKVFCQERYISCHWSFLGNSWQHWLWNSFASPSSYIKTASIECTMPIRFLSLSVQAISKYNHTQKFEGKKEERKHIGTSEKKSPFWNIF